MHYLGGKSRIADPLAEYLESRRAGRQFSEPFCGGLSVTVRMRGAPRLAADANLALITLYRAVMAGWDPPTALTADEYAALRTTQDPLDPRTAYAGIGCSFAGKWFAGFTRPPKSGPTRDYVGAARRALLRDLALCRDVRFEHMSYKDWDFGAGHLVYCDPPYAGTTGYAACGRFDSGAFWARCRQWAASGALVLVSEYRAPEDCRCVWEYATKTDMRVADGTKSARVERLFEVPARGV